MAVALSCGRWMVGWVDWAAENKELKTNSHFDPFYNLNILLSGSKRFDFAPPHNTVSPIASAPHPLPQRQRLAGDC